MNGFDFFDRTFSKELKRLKYPFELSLFILCNYIQWRVGEEEEMK